MRSFLITIIGLGCLYSPTVAADKAPPSAVQWSDQFPRVPDAHGFAGPFAGIVGEGSDRWLLLAGGANFPDGAPWVADADGKKPSKVWHDGMFALQLSGSKLKPAGEWKKLDQKLPQKLAYGASVSLPHRKTALFIGGNWATTEGMNYSRKVYEVSRKGGKFALSELAELPVGVAECGAAIIDNRVYVFSGSYQGGFAAQGWMLDTSAEDESTWQWQSIPWPESSPGVAARARQYCVAGVQGGKLYVFGGRTAMDVSIPHPDVDRNRIHKLDFLRDCYEFNPKNQKWKRIADMPVGMSAAPSNAISAGVSHLLVMGGVPVDFLRDQVKARPQLNGLGFDHPGFPATIHSYHTITNTWTTAGEIPRGSESDRRANKREVGYAPVTVPVIQVGNSFIIPSGEIKPGIRSSQVLFGTVASEKLGFGIVNWIIVVVYLLGMVAIGYWFMKRESASNTDAYFRGGQRIPWWVAGLSIFATMLSAITFMAIPASAYASNWNGYVGQWPILLIVPLVVFFYLPFYRRLNVTTAYEYLEKRFNTACRVIGSVTFMLFHIGRVAIVLYLPALALSSVTNIDVLAAIAIIGVLCVIYTVMGGIEAVVWTDAIQAIVLIGGALLCFGLVVYQVDGGLSAIGNAMTEQGKGIAASWKVSDISISKTSTSAIVLFVAFMFANLPSYTAGQDVVQRYVTTSSEKEAARSLWLNIVMVLCGSAIFFALGTALYVFYQSQPELLDPAMPAKDGILPFFILQNLPIGIAGLIIAGVFAAAQSTISSSLNSVATAFVTDIYSRILKPASSDQQQLSVARIVVIFLGITGMLVSGWIATTGVDSAFMLFNQFIGFALGPLGGLFALGIFTRHGNGLSGLLALLTGVSTVVTIHLMKLDVMPLLYGFLGIVSVLISGVIYGCIFRSNSDDLQGLTLFTQKK